MFVDKWLTTTALYAPDGVGTDTTPQDQTPPPQIEGGEEAPQAEGPGSGRSNLRRQLEGEFDRQRTQDTERDTRARTRKPVVAGGAPETPEGEQAPIEGQEQQQVDIQPPEGFSKEAKAEWASTPPNVRAAIVKREQDMNKGVADLKGKYKDLDDVLGKRLDTIRRHGHTPAQAVNQLFAWFEALTANPRQAFPLLLQSFRVDPAEVFPQLKQQQQPTQQELQQRQYELQQVQQQNQPPAALQPYLDKIATLEQSLEQLNNAVGTKFNSIEQAWANQSQKQTQEMLDGWSKDKPHFEDVRQMMAHLITPGPPSNMYPNGSPPAVPPLANGAADLDTAYDMAVNAMPEVRAKVRQAEQEKAEAERKANEAKEKKAQQEAADKARKAGNSLSPSAPGSPIVPQKNTKKGKSVRESLQDAIKEASTSRI
jgi:hypothetical protein